ncbi:hypothetical protein J6590_048391 [Homalodisca vitripennis]|nr:hypothetical protein J6590_048391 [Homalodisca vitripennis]
MFRSIYEVRYGQWKTTTPQRLTQPRCFTSCFKGYLHKRLLEPRRRLGTSHSNWETSGVLLAAWWWTEWGWGEISRCECVAEGGWCGDPNLTTTMGSV